MKKILSYMIFVVIGVAFLLLGIFVTPQNSEYLYFSDALEKFGLFLRRLILSENGFKIFLGYFIYIIIGILPLIYPVLRFAIKRKWNYTSFLWPIVSGLSYMSMYFLINPHKIPHVDFIEYQKVQDVAVFGLMIAVFGSALFILILDYYKKINEDSKCTINAGKAILSFTVVYILFKTLFFKVLYVRNGFDKINSVDPDAFEMLGINKGINYFYFIMVFIINLIPSIIIILLIRNVFDFLTNYKNNLFDKTNAKVLKRVNKLCIISLLALIASNVITNLLTFGLQKNLIKFDYMLDAKLGFIIITILCTLFCNLLNRSIEIDEENRLTI